MWMSLKPGDGLRLIRRPLPPLSPGRVGVSDVSESMGRPFVLAKRFFLWKNDRLEIIGSI